VFAPAKTPPEIIERLATEIGRALVDPAVRTQLLESGQEPVGGSADQFALFVSDEYLKLGRLVKELNIKIE
jgi:tripartite-type tricarboxylate transporter receptor subunit TctC